MERFRGPDSILIHIITGRDRIGERERERTGYEVVDRGGAGRVKPTAPPGCGVGPGSGPAGCHPAAPIARRPCVTATRMCSHLGRAAFRDRHVRGTPLSSSCCRTINLPRVGQRCSQSAGMFRRALSVTGSQQMLAGKSGLSCW